MNGSEDEWATEPDETRHLYEVSDIQRRAAEEVVTGSSLTAIADLLGISRQTVSGWVNHHPAFQALVNELRRDSNAISRDLARRIDLASARAVLEAVESGDIKAALGWLRLRPIVGEADIIGPVEAEPIVEHRAKAFQNRMEAERTDARLNGHMMIDSATAFQAVEAQMARNNSSETTSENG